MGHGRAVARYRTGNICLVQAGRFPKSRQVPAQLLLLFSKVSRLTRHPVLPTPPVSPQPPNHEPAASVTLTMCALSHPLPHMPAHGFRSSWKPPEPLIRTVLAASGTAPDLGRQKTTPKGNNRATQATPDGPPPRAHDHLPSTRRGRVHQSALDQRGRSDRVEPTPDELLRAAPR